MFNRQYKLLKQLQDVQLKIRQCKASIASLNPPAPDSMKLEANMLRWLQSLACDQKPRVEELLQMRFTGFEDATCDYLRKLGDYFINVAEYYNQTKQYNSEWRKLQEEERRLKEKLGID